MVVADFPPPAWRCPSVGCGHEIRDPNKAPKHGEECPNCHAVVDASNPTLSSVQTAAVQLHPVMWVWSHKLRPHRWLLAVRMPWHPDAEVAYQLYETDGTPLDWTGKIFDHYSHRTPIYAPRSTPE